MLDAVVRDVRYTVRSLARTPVFAATIILTLAFGIGANTAIFSIVDRLLLRPLPYPNGEQIVMLHENSRRARRMDVSPANWLDWQRDSRSFESLAAWNNRFPSTLTGQGEPERLKADTVSYEFFTVLGVKPTLGRVFTADDDQPGSPRRVILSYSLWQRKFGGDDNIIGKTIALNAAPAEVIGVMPAGFHFMGNDTDVWNPFALDRNRAWRESAGRFIPFVVGRLKPSVTAAGVQTEMATIAARLAQLHAFNKDTSVKVIPLREVMTGEVRTSLLILFAAVGVLLLIACCNVANLLVARSAYRRREIAIRTSLGAGRGVIIRQLMIETLTLALAGGITAMLVAKWSIRVLLVLTPPSLLQLAAVPIDGWMLLYTLGLTLITGVVLGFAPAIPSIRGELTDYLREGTRSVTSSTHLRQGLIVVQVAMTVVLLCGASLLVRSLLALTNDPTGVHANDVLTLRVELPTSSYDPARQVNFFRQVIERLQNLPGVLSAGAGRDIPVSTARISGTGFYIQGEPELPANELPSTFVRVATPGYFKTLGIPVLNGREFTEPDLAEGVPFTFVVNEAFAKKYLSNRDPLSTAISVRMQLDKSFGRIVGVAANVKDGSLRGVAEPTVFYNNGHLPSPGMTIMIRTSRGLELAPEATRIIREFDRNLPVIDVRMLENAFAESVARERLNALVSAAFAISALLLASLGLYGLIAYIVEERTNEIGIRMALGARTSEVLRLIMTNGLQLVALGAGVGLAAAFALSRFLESLLFGVTTHDPMTFTGVAVVLVVVSALAVLIPARRATMVNPLVALRRD
jgi:putative ABC transport system permease protein